MPDRFDLIVLGAGAAGSGAATQAVERGATVALIERDKLGGTCLNYGCDPTKTLIAIGRQFRAARRAEAYGMEVAGRVDWPAVRARVNAVIEELRGGSVEEARRSKEEKGIDLRFGDAAFVDEQAIEVGGERLRGDRFLIATGSSPVIPDIDGLEETGYLTNVGAVSMARLPTCLAVIGAGPTGVEFAQVFCRLGVDVHLIEIGPRILPDEDADLAESLLGCLTGEGIDAEIGGNVTACCTKGQKQLTIECAGGSTRTLGVDEILIATGRRPALDELNLPAAGVAVGEKGIEVDDRMRTNVEHIAAAGDVVGGKFTQVASAQAKIAVACLFGDEEHRFDLRNVPYAIYTDPELARIGCTETELREQGRDYEVRRLDLAELPRAVIEDRKAGAIKLLVDKAGRILGAHLLAPHAGDLVAPLVLAVRLGLPADAIYETLQPYPTLAEGVRYAAKGD